VVGGESLMPFPPLSLLLLLLSQLPLSRCCCAEEEEADVVVVSIFVVSIFRLYSVLRSEVESSRGGLRRRPVVPLVWIFLSTLSFETCVCLLLKKRSTNNSF